jgi:predicted component of type VI protein secretion system
MRAVIVTGGLVTAVIDLTGKTIDPDGRAARGPATYSVEGPGGAEDVTYEAVIAAPEGVLLVASDEAAPGWTWDGEAFSPPAGGESEPAAPLSAITRRQLRLTLLAHGLLDQVEPVIQSLPEPDRSIATIEWQDASEYQRDHPLIEQIGAALDLAPSDIDAMWREAMGR